MSGLWIAVTLAAAALQTARNAAQAGLVARIGVIGATQTRFIYGLPFALIFLGLISLTMGEAPPAPDERVLAAALIGALAQIAATALLLSAMRSTGFASATALSKTEPALVALVGALALGEAPTALSLLAIAAAMLGAQLMSGAARRRGALTGIAAGAGFAVAAVGFRAAIMGLEGGFLIRAATALVIALTIQCAALGAWMALFARPALIGSLRLWRQSLGAGVFGAAASQGWFLGFALTSAANVRTLALVEVLLARAVSGRLFAERMTPRQSLGAALIVAGAAGLIWG